MSYDVRNHWNHVADLISTRDSDTQLAGYDSLFDRYARSKIVDQIRKIQVFDKDVMEVGSGSGLNLLLLDAARPRSITAVDVSEKMLELAKTNMRQTRTPIKFVHIDGRSLPMPDASLDYAFTITVLQHNSDIEVLQSLVGNITRVVRERVYLFEDIASIEKGTPDYMLRPVEFYQSLFEKHGFHLVETRFIGLFYTQKLFSLFNRLTGLYKKKEGAATPTMLRFIQYPFLPITMLLDKLFVRQEGNALMVFERID